MAVTDEVWSKLDPYAGQLTPRTIRRVRIAVATVVALAVAAAGLWWSGLVVPRVSWPTGNVGYGSSTAPGWMEHDLLIENNGLRPVDIVEVGRSGPGLRLTKVEGQLPARLMPGSRLELRLVYAVTDCAAVPAEAWPVPVRVKRASGTYTAYVDLPTESHPPNGYREFVGRDPDAVEWQRALADGSCASR
jgi:hypothetical protein